MMQHQITTTSENKGHWCSNDSDLWT